jgi:hypothetical protein
LNRTGGVNFAGGDAPPRVRGGPAPASPTFSLLVLDSPRFDYEDEDEDEDDEDEDQDEAVGAGQWENDQGLLCFGVPDVFSVPLCLRG